MSSTYVYNGVLPLTVRDSNDFIIDFTYTDLVVYSNSEINRTVFPILGCLGDWLWSLGSSGAPHHGNPPTGSGPNPRSQSSQNSTNPSVQHSTKQNTTNQLPKEKEKKKYHLNGDKKSKKLDLEEKNGREKSDNITDKTKDNKQSANLANSNNSRRDGHNNNETKEVSFFFIKTINFLFI